MNARAPLTLHLHHPERCWSLFGHYFVVVAALENRWHIVDVTYADGNLCVILVETVGRDQRQQVLVCRCV